MKRKLVVLWLSFVAVSGLGAGTNRATCAVLTFDAKDGVSKGQAELLTERFATEFGKLGGYRLMSRDKMGELLKAQQYSRSDNCSASECAIEAGKMLSIQYIVYGSVGHLGKTYTVNAGLANVESGETERPVSHDIQGEIDDVLTKGMQAAAWELAGLVRDESTEAGRGGAPNHKEEGRTAPSEGLTSLTLPERAGRSGGPLWLDLGGGITMELVWVEALKGWVGKYEVTNGEYRRCKADHDSGEWKRHNLNGDRQPVVEMSYNDAVAFCKWINRTCEGQVPKGYTIRLPDGEEWLTYAQCGDGREYPWGSGWPPKYGNYVSMSSKAVFPERSDADGYSDGDVVTCAVEKSGKNEWGLYGVGGNVWEWTSEQEGVTRVLRGASWNYGGRDVLRCLDRLRYHPAFRGNNIGLRVVLMR